MRKCPETRPYLELFSSEQLDTVGECIARNGEIYVQVWYPHGGGHDCAYLVQSFSQFRDLVSRQLWPQIEIVAYLDVQYPVRGPANEDLLRRAKAAIPEGEEFDIIDAEDTYPSGVSFFGDGSNHQELERELDNVQGELVGVGPPAPCPNAEWLSSHRDEVVYVQYRGPWPKTRWWQRWFGRNRPLRFSCVGESALDTAVMSGTKAVKNVLRHGADVNAQGWKGRTSLHLAMQASFRPTTRAIVEVLLRNGADPNARNCFGFTPVFYVTRSKAPRELIALLADHGADLNATDDEGETALDHAVAQKSEAAVDAFRERGAKSGRELGNCGTEDLPTNALT